MRFSFVALAILVVVPLLPLAHFVQAETPQEYQETQELRRKEREKREREEKQYTDAINTFAQKASDQRKVAWNKYQSATVKISNSFNAKSEKIIEKIRILQGQGNNDEKIAKLENQLKDLGGKKIEALTKANQKYGQDTDKIGEQCVKKADKLKVPETMWKINAEPICNARGVGEIYQQFLNPAAR